MSKEEMKEMREKILKGITLSYERLVEQKKKDDGVLVFSREDGEIVEVRARDL